VLAEVKLGLEYFPGFAGRRFDVDSAAWIKNFPVVSKQLGFVVKQIHLTRPAIHEKLDDPFCLCGMVSPLPKDSRTEQLLLAEELG
jgi:hypothetical protein